MPRRRSYRGVRAKKLTKVAAISDDEQSDVGDVAVPIHSKRSKSRSAELQDDQSDAKSDDDIPKIQGDINGDAAEATAADDDEEEDEDLEADEYVVEKIIDHLVADDGTVSFKVKWEGYDKKSDQTWEPEDSLKEGATDILEEYLEKLGGREMLFEEKAKAKATKKRGRPASSATPPAGKRSKRNGHPGESTPPASAKSAKSKEWKLPSGSWEDDVESIDACEDENTGSLIVYLNWRNGNKTKHPTEVVYKRCPQKMLQFYERHIRIIKSDAAGTEVEAKADPEASTADELL
ncbi:Chromatin-associated protein swi6 [Colletotrichum spinosum]|uniref:Chromatin-associated protein swi6 n=1 Tax=Colletotrichum spinosum TaxID=1347390 RepID=A0A4R8Q639_9PEZI|nr:Chromatin-associated protein swi6 [Colletotrichum spinosum]